MAYTPNNNPYIAGDPYSYDLKWLVCKVKTAIDGITSLISRVDKLEHTAVIAAVVDTVEDLKALKGVKVDSMVQTRGYYDINDGGGAVYNITDAAPSTYYETLNNGLFAELVNEVANVKQYGAYGDGVNDDYNAIMQAYGDSRTKKIICYFPAGTYNHSTTLTFNALTSTGIENSFMPILAGAGESSTSLKFTGNSGDGVTIDVVDSGYINGITIYGLDFTGGEKSLNIAKRGTRIYIDHIRTHDSTVSGVHFSGETWLTTFTNSYIQPTSGDGVNMAAGGTTRFVDNIYVYGATNTAYRIRGTYCTFGSLAADSCSGESVYAFNYFDGFIGALGFEGSTTAKPIQIVNSHVSIGALTSYGGDFSASDHIIELSSSTALIDIATFSASTAETLTTPFIRLFSSKLTINNLVGNKTFTNTFHSDSDNTSAFEINNNKTSILIRRADHRPFIGNDRRDNSTALINNSGFGAALFTDCKNGPRYNNAGDDLRWNTPTSAGDWFVELDPAANGVAGYSILVGSSGDITNASIRPILLGGYGATANRPTAPTQGAMYYDTTINKAIWYIGGAWKDATGATV